MGYDAATQAAQNLLRAQPPCTLVCVTGFCGGLTDHAAVGDLILADVILAEGDAARYAVPPAVFDPAWQALTNAGLPCHRGALTTSRVPVTTPARKRELGIARQALAVDMESHAIAQILGATIPVLALRAVSDAVNDELPPEAAAFVSQSGKTRLGPVTRYAMRRPKNIKTLWELKRRSDIALKNLTAAWRVLWPVLCPQQEQ
jgi:nucleoside phosphorylase